MSQAPQHEHEFEAAPGLPEALPQGERLLWQGAPNWRTLANEVLHVRALSIYFAVLLAWRAGNVLYDGGTVAQAGLSVAILAPVALLALGLLTLVAWLMARTTIYTITDRRVVMRIGIVLNVTFNIPHRMIEAASLRPGTQGVGDIALTLLPTERIAYGHLWPHARPWKLKRTEPMLRALPDAKRVGQLLTNAIMNLPTDSPLPAAVHVSAPTASPTLAPRPAQATVQTATA